MTLRKVSAGSDRSMRRLQFDMRVTLDPDQVAAPGWNGFLRCSGWRYMSLLSSYPVQPNESMAIVWLGENRDSEAWIGERHNIEIRGTEWLKFYNPAFAAGHLPASGSYLADILLHNQRREDRSDKLPFQLTRLYTVEASSQVDIGWGPYCLPVLVPEDHILSGWVPYARLSFTWVTVNPAAGLTGSIFWAGEASWTTPLPKDIPAVFNPVPAQSANVTLVNGTGAAEQVLVMASWA